MSGLQGKVAVVTGAASGNGRAMAVRFAQDGADVVVADVNEAGIEDTCAMVRAAGRRALGVRCDVSRLADIDAMYEATLREFARLDIAVANAGVAERDMNCLTLTEEAWDRTIDVNLKGVFFTLQGAARRMVAAGTKGRLIAISSILGEWGMANVPAYCASKGGVKQMVKAFAVALGHQGITCNAIGPGFIRTGMTARTLENQAMEGYLVDRTPAGLVGEPEDVAAVAAFLVRDDARFVNGSTLFPDGGITAGLYSNQVRQAVAAQAGAASA